MNFCDTIKYDEKGLVATVIQDEKTKEVLMVAYMNKDSLSKTLEIGQTCFWSRSRQKFWVKGESSGNVQKVKAIFFDCDKDCLLIHVEQVGGAACHVGYKSCFYREVDRETGETKVIGEPVFDPNNVYKK
ncbi:phosphoribosyl-AMP cyclohydrolase [PVC group bacterium (ex Bugula neritina AB1)]|nr:phosphoribosyl-AMP cyclohydrolase [PVC group bacterium (ex Bugula neritina AB1)]